jgi:glycosyltransferase involved in cell wall biosynthesis
MKAPRVLFVHNRYRLPGGEDAVVDAEIELLKNRGHEVEIYIRDNHELEGMRPFDALAQTVWSRRSWRDVQWLIGAFRPDVIHVHNTFARVSSSIYWAAARAGVPVVQTLHNFRLMCVQAMFLQNDNVCEDCLGRVPWRGVVRKCYRGSHLESAALAATLGVHRALGTFRDKVTRYIALTEFCRRKFIEGGLPASRVTVKPNFADIAHPGDGPRSGGLYVGRLSSEKGLATLMAALELLPGIVLDVIGDGPEAARVRDHPGLKLRGWLSHEEIYARMRGASYLVMPSIWYENFPRTLIEAFGNGLPIIASHRGSLLELVDHGCTGLLFRPGSAEDLAQHIGWAETHSGAMRLMGTNARRKYEDEFTPDRNYERMMAIYRDAIAAAKPATEPPAKMRAA